MTICWNCDRAYRNADGCCWAWKFEPVEGWTARETVLHQGHLSPVKSYEVIECPQFLPSHKQTECVKILTINGQTKTIKEWAEIIGYCDSTIRNWGGDMGMTMRLKKLLN